MKIIPLSQTGIHANWFPLQAKYKHDDNVELKKTKVISNDQLSLTLDKILQNPNASEVNNHSLFALTPPTTLESFVELKLPQDETQIVFTTTLLMDESDPHYLCLPDDYIDPLVRDPKQGQVKFIKPYEQLQKNVSIVGHDSFFEIQIDKRNGQYYAQIFHESSRNNTNTIFTLKHIRGSVGLYKINSRSDYKDNYLDMSNKFECILDLESSAIILIVPAYRDKNVGIVVPDVYNNKINIQGYSSPDDFADPRVLIRIKHNRINVDSFQNQSFSSNWVVYQDKINTNHVSIDESRSHKNVNNNFLVNCEYETIDSFNLEIDITPLKNQLTTEHGNVIYDPYRRRQGKVRDYDKIFTGSNESGGYDSIAAGYTSYIEKLEFDPGKLTYFHIPREMYPLKKLNINDSGLSESGSIPGDTPLRADKVFKKRAGYDDNTNHGSAEEEHVGKWLCSWLYRNPDDGKAIWVDRYYQPDLTTSNLALTLPPVKSSITYNSQYTSKIKDVGSDLPVYDKISDLCFEPGGLYAYYHLGSNDLEKIITDISKHAIELSVYTINDLSSLTNTKSTPGNVLMFNETVKDYAIATIPKNREKKNSITISMTLSSSDWSKEFGGTLIGNYLDRGINIINKRIMTPIQLLRHDNYIHVYNNDFEKINTIDIGTNNFKITETEYFQSLAVLVEDDTGLYLHRYSTISPFIVTKHLIDEDWSARNKRLMDVTVKSTEDKIYIIDDSTTGTYAYIDTVDLQMFTGLSATFVQDMNSLVAVDWRATNIIPLNDEVYVFDDMLTRVDGNDHVWFVKDNKLDLYRFDPELNLITGEVRLVQPNETGFPMSVYFPGDEIVDIKFDRNNDLWILYKLNNRYRCNKISVDRVNSAQKQILAQIDLEPLDSTTYPEDWTWDNFLGLIYTPPAPPADQSDPGNLSGSWVFSASLGNRWVYNAVETNWYWFQDLEQWIYIQSYDPTDTIYMDFTFDSDHDNIYFIYDGEYDTNVPLFNTLMYSNTQNQWVTGKDFYNWTKSTEPPSAIQWSSLQDTFDSIVVGDKVSSLSSLIEYTSLSKPGSLIKKYDLNGGYVTQKIIDDELKISDLYKQDVSGLQFLVSQFYRYDKSNYLFVKCRLHNPVDFDDISEVTLVTQVEQFNHGTHDLVVVGDSENGALGLYIDGELKSQKRFDNLRYRFDELIDKTIYIGTSPGVRGLPLYESIQKKSGLDITNISIYNLKLYNTALYHYEIEHLHRQHTGIKSVSWSLPGGVRNYIDTIDKTLKQSQQGRKSNYFDIDIRTDSLSDISIMEKITGKLKEYLPSISPANMIPRTVTWSDPVPNDSIQALVDQFDTYYYFKDCSDYPVIEPTPTPTLVPDPTPEPTPQPTPEPTPTPIPPTPFPSPTPTATFPPTPTPTATFPPTPTPTPSPSPSPSLSPTPTASPTPSPTPTPTATQSPILPCDGFPYSVLIDQETVDDNEIAFFRAEIGSRVCHFGASGGAGSATIVYLDNVPTFQISIAGTLLNNSIRFITMNGEVYEGVINPTGETKLVSV